MQGAGEVGGVAGGFGPGQVPVERDGFLGGGQGAAALPHRGQPGGERKQSGGQGRAGLVGGFLLGPPAGVADGDLLEGDVQARPVLIPDEAEQPRHFGGRQVMAVYFGNEHLLQHRGSRPPAVAAPLAVS